MLILSGRHSRWTKIGSVELQEPPGLLMALGAGVIGVVEFLAASGSLSSGMTLCVCVPVARCSLRARGIDLGDSSLGQGAMAGP